MKSVPFIERAEFWKFQSAAISFEMVRDVCDYLLQNQLSKSHPIHDPLVTAIYTLYGRPFKQRAPLRLSEDIVPERYRPIHFGLITFRDKMFAHTDIDSPKTVDGYALNELAGFTRNAQTRFGITIVTPILPSVRDLCIELYGHVHSKANVIWRKHMPKERVSDGTTIVNLSVKDGPFLVPHPVLA
ncbi:MAG TPA: hypothetical protein VE344_08490 [Methylomirabilota bacterium]|nr:hypothetical protein [Methylomirabilota bacterium]